MNSLAVAFALLAAAPKVDKVVVYPDRAQVTRVLPVACGPRAQVTFLAIPPAADATTFRARAVGGSIEGLRSEERTRADQFAPELKTLDEQVRKLERELAAVDDASARNRELARLGAQYGEVAVQLVSREMADGKPDLKAWAGAFDVSLSSRLKAAADEVEQNAKRRELGYKLEDLRRKQARLAAAAQRREWVAEVLVSCAPGASAQVELTYMVGGASWEPGYEARAEEGSGVVELSTFATLRQATGEDWRGAKLVLSTAVPTQNATPPEIAALKVYAEEREAEKKVLVRRDEYVEHAEEGKDTGGAVSGKQPGLAARAQGLSVQLVVPEAGDVPGDGSPVRLFVAKQKMKAKFAMRTFPKLAPFVFRVADLTNQAPFPLLPGTLDAFRSTGFIARYSLERVPQGGMFHLTFGIDESLRVKRTVLSEVKRDTGLFGGNKRFHFAYRFELANYAKGTVELEVADHLPVSELDDVKVELEPQTTAGYQLNAPDGIATWKVKLAPAEQRKLELAFHIDVPSSYDSGGL
ncbi:MAG: mucoidy inhibitor MuiA family protein [Myxococcaceae bacterium]